MDPKRQRPPATVVIVAAGAGERLGADRPKALVEVAGRPLYEWSLRAALAAQLVAAAVIAAPPGREAEIEARLGAAGLAEAVTVVAGGAARSESALRALAAVASELVAVHDAARPLAEPALFDAVIERLGEVPELAGVIAATPVTDTVKRARAAAPKGVDGPGEAGAGGAGLALVAETLDRSQLWAAQTPQAFRTATLREALADPEALAKATDDASLVEALGGQVGLYPASPANFKVTTPADLERAASILGRDR